MFRNLDKKLKVLAKVNFVLGCIEAIALLIVLCYSNRHIFWVRSEYLGESLGNLFWDLLLGIAGGALIILFAWIGSWFIYGFGELIESTQETNRLLSTHFSKETTQETEELFKTDVKW